MAEIETPEFIDQIKQTVASQLKPLQDQCEAQSAKIGALEQQVAAAQKPIKNGGGLFAGSAPGVRVGESQLSSRGYRFSNLFRALKTGNWENAKLESEVSDHLAKAYGTPGEGVYAPIGGAHLQRIEDDNVRLEIQAAVRQGVAGALSSDWGVIRQFAGTMDDTNLGVLLGSVQQGELIDLLRSKEIFSRAGARELTLPVNGQIQFPRVTQEMDAYWVGEGVEVGETSMKAGMLTMVAKKMSAITKWSEELLKFGTPATEALIRDELARALARLSDLTFLNGVGSQVSPKGLLSYAGLVTHSASTSGTDGDTLGPQDLPLLLAKIAENDVDIEGAVAFMRPLLKARVSTARADAVSAGDQKGPFLFPYTEKDGVSKLGGVPILDSTRIPNNRIKGSGNALTMVIAGVFSEFLIGRAGVVEFSTNTQSETNFKNGLISLKATQFLDGVCRRPEAFGYIDKLVST